MQVPLLFPIHHEALSLTRMLDQVLSIPFHTGFEKEINYILFVITRAIY